MPSAPQRSPFLEEVRNAIRVKHYSIRTEQVYVDWVKRFILFHEKQHPKDMGAVEVRNFLTHLAVDRHVAASTQNQALNALVFLYKGARLSARWAEYCEQGGSGATPARYSPGDRVRGN